MSDIEDPKRRRFLKMTAGSAGGLAAASMWPGLIEKALALEPNNPTGCASLADIEHVIVFMQENRSFDHYFGMLPGVRGYGDPRPVPLPSGNYVWYQPEGLNPASRGFSADVPYAQWTNPAAWYQSDRALQSADYVLPFRLNQPGNVQFQYMTDLNHSWKASQQIWSNWDSWLPLKSRQSMGGLDREDLPFYYRLADAFTVCDDYHCSVFAATDPNRFYLWSGTCPPPMNFPDNYGSGGYVANIDYDINSDITSAMYGQSPQARAAAVAAGIADWKTFAETLTDHAITWKIYQENDNYGDNYLQYFKNFRIDNHGVPIDQSSDPYFQTLYRRGRVFADTPGALGTALLAEFAKDVAAGAEPDDPALGTVRPGLPRVSWIVAPYRFCEHPSASPGDGEGFTAQLLDTLVNQHPEVFRKTAFLLMYDENDGYFDHQPPPVPPLSLTYGQMTLPDAGAAENFDSVPVGLGPRVPMLIVSPWTTGGKVYSQLSDHTSVLRFLEQWLAAKRLSRHGEPRCELISDWRRSVCGDLTEAFDFGQPDQPPRIDPAAPFHNGTAAATVPNPQSFPALAPQTRPACALRQACSVDGRATSRGFTLRFANAGTVGAAFIAYAQPMSGAQQAFHYTVEAGKYLDATPRIAAGPYDWAVYGQNGYLREFRGAASVPGTPEVSAAFDLMRGSLRIHLDNRDNPRACRFLLSDNAYAENEPLQIVVAAGDEQHIPWRTAAGWYDVSVRIADDLAYYRRVAGCATAHRRDASTDPAIGNSERFKPALASHGERNDTLRFDYVTPPWHHRPGNWLGIFPAGAAPTTANLLRRLAAPRGIGSVALTGTSDAPLPPGRYEAWYFFEGSDTPLVAQATPFAIER